MKRFGKPAWWLAGIIVILVLATPAVLSATPAEPRYLCAQCHAMAPLYQSYLASPHRAALTCSGCHIPHGSVAGALATKYTDGARHVIAQIKGAEPVEISEQALETVLDNCIACHTDVAHVQEPASRYCITCHADEPHGNPAGARSAQIGP